MRMHCKKRFYTLWHRHFHTHTHFYTHPFTLTLLHICVFTHTHFYLHTHTPLILGICKLQWWCSCTRLARFLGPSSLRNRWNQCSSMIVGVRSHISANYSGSLASNVTELARSYLRLKEHCKLRQAGQIRVKSCRTTELDSLLNSSNWVSQVQGGDQPPLPTNGNSFVACSMPKVLHAPAGMCIELSYNEFRRSTAELRFKWQ